MNKAGRDKVLEVIEKSKHHKLSNKLIHAKKAAYDLKYSDLQELYQYINNLPRIKPRNK